LNKRPADASAIRHGRAAGVAWHRQLLSGFQRLVSVSVHQLGETTMQYRIFVMRRMEGRRSDYADENPPGPKPKAGDKFEVMCGDEKVKVRVTRIANEDGREIVYAVEH
jgi:hypothetical protein